MFWTVLAVLLMGLCLLGGYALVLGVRAAQRRIRSYPTRRDRLVNLRHRLDNEYRVLPEGSSRKELVAHYRVLVEQELAHIDEARETRRRLDLDKEVWRELNL